MSSSFTICALATAISAFVSLAFSIAAVRNPGGTFTLYACARSVALAVISVIPFLNGSAQWLEAIAIAMVIVQALDAGVGATMQNRIKTFGPAGTAIANLVALLWLVLA